MFGLGVQEFIVLGVMGAVWLGVALLVVCLANRGSSRVQDLEDDNRRLREDLDRRRS